MQILVIPMILLIQTQINQALQVNKIISNGYFEEPLSQAKILDHYHNFLFFINITNLQINYDQLNYNFNALQKNRTIDELSHRIYLQLKSNLAQIEQILHKFINKKVKRGLANFIGKGIKFITGNLDDDDLKTINENIESLHQIKNSEIERINKLTSFANHLTQRYSEDLALLNDNIQHTKLLFQNIKSTEQFRMTVEYQILQAEDLLNTFLMLERTISFAMKGIPNLELIKIDELLLIGKYLEKIYKPQQLSPIDHVHLYKTIEFAKISVIGTDESITFLLKIPILKQITTNYSRVYPLPNHQDIAVIPPKKYLVRINYEEYWTNEACISTLGSSIVLCLQPPVKEACILSSPDQCQKVLIKNNYKIIHTLQNKQLLTLFKNTQTILEDCHGIIMKKSIQGINLLHSDCTIIIDNSIFDNTEPIFEMKFENISKLPLSYDYKMELQLKHLREPTSILQEAEKLQNQPIYLHPITQLTHYTISGILLCFIIIGTITVMINRVRIRDLLYNPRKIIRIDLENNPVDPTDNEDVI
ncbi:uncharacterized protein LOC123672072 [Harmonia axyridis]|uniref:uncharacterized protein LOC123672072 n=1 Tax=Harmonia axyridis TaxID=115357 RepID=UPI001E2752B0|nr:uncharacterized protein LOC123672072 [Harmonia axyridis]